MRFFVFSHSAIQKSILESNPSRRYEKSHGKIHGFFSLNSTVA